MAKPKSILVKVHRSGTAKEKLYKKKGGERFGEKRGQKDNKQQVGKDPKCWSKGSGKTEGNSAKWKKEKNHSYLKE